MLKIFYFASIREYVGIEQEEIELSSAIKTVADLVIFLQSRHRGFNTATAEIQKLLVAVNQTIVDESYSLARTDEVAFFPPMTGG